MDLRITTIILLVLISLIGCSRVEPGSNLLSESDAIKIASEQAKLTAVTRVQLATAGPIYRVVYGEDFSGQQKVAWVQDRVNFTVMLKEGIPEEKALQIAQNKGFGEGCVIQLIYVSTNAKENIHRFLINTSSLVFWWIKSPEAEAKHQLFLDFYNGEVAYEINN